MSVRVHNWMGEQSYLGVSKAIVTDNKDPDKKGRVRVLSPIFGETAWIPYITVEDGFFGPPDIGSIVYIETDGGDEDFLLVRGTVIDGDAPEIDTRDEFQRLIPTNRGWATPGPLDAKGKKIDPNSGHLIELDDGIALSSSGKVIQSKENKGIRFTTSGGSFLKFWEEEADGASKNRIELGTSDANLFQITDAIDSEGQKILLTDKDGRTIEIIQESDNIRLRDQSTSKYIDLKFSDDIIEIESSTIKIGSGAIEPIILGNQWVTYNNVQIVATLNALILAYTSLSGTMSTHTHPYTWEDGPGAGDTSPSGSSGPAAPAPAGLAGAPQLAIKGKVE